MYRERYGLNDPLLIQYFNWIKGIVTEGSFGYSMAYGRDVGELIAERMPRTLILALLAHAHLHAGGHLCRHLCRPAPVQPERQPGGVLCLFLHVGAALLDRAGHHLPAGLYLWAAARQLLSTPPYTCSALVRWPALQLGQAGGLYQAHLAGDRDRRAGRGGAQHARHARQPAGRAQRPVRDHGALQGVDRAQGDGTSTPCPTPCTPS